MRYAPTFFCLIIGWDGDFFACSLTWRAYAIRPYRFCQNRLGASKNCGRYFSTERIDTSSYRYFLPAKIFTSSYRYFLVLQTETARRTGTFWCCKLKRLVVPVLFDEYFYNVKTYRYFCYKKSHLLTDMCIFLKADFVRPKQCLA